MKKRRIGIIGGGASGILAAITAARAGTDVTIIEKKDRIGKKILATGNGKCNLSNLSFSGKEYHSEDFPLLEPYFRQFSPKETVRFFEECGLLLQNRDGYLYPRSGQAASVLDVLRYELERLGVTIVTDCRVTEIAVRHDAAQGRFLVRSQDGTSFTFDRILLSCGTPAGEKPGEGMDGYALARSLGHHMIKPLPALVQLRCRGNDLKALAGVRCDCRMQVHIEGRKRPLSERGELQLTDYGISGIPVFQFSRHVSRALEEKKTVRVFLDFLPDYTEADWLQFCRRRKQQKAGQTAEMFFAGMLNKKLMAVLCRQAGLKPDTVLSRAREEAADRVFALIRRFPMEVYAVNSYTQAQVCCGGVPLREVDSHLQSLKTKGLYLSGELLDVDGRCGGYNLQWAWTSGFLAGSHMAGASCERHGQ